MKYLTADIYRSTYDCDLNHFHGCKMVGYFTPDGIYDSDEKPGDVYVRIISHPAGRQHGIIAVPCDHTGAQISKPGCNRMSGGTFVSSCDSRFGEHCERAGGHRFGGAVSLHDRFEPSR